LCYQLTSTQFFSSGPATALALSFSCYDYFLGSRNGALAMAGAKWTNDDLRSVALAAGIFVLFGAVIGFFGYFGLLLGAIGGAICFASIIGLASLIELTQRKEQ
jgi:hypothetical protein